MRFLFLVSTFVAIFLSSISIGVGCGFFDINCNSSTSVIYCQTGDNCSLSGGTDIVGNGINDIEKTRTFSQFIQDIVAYLLLFLWIIGVIYIIYAGFNMLTAAGDEDKVKKSKTTIFHVIIGLLIIFLAYSIVKFFIGSGGTGGVFNNALKLPSFIEKTYAYTDYDTNTFDNYKKQIELLSSTLDREYQVDNKISSKTLTDLESLVKASMETFPDSDDIIFNTNLANSLLTAIEMVKKTPDSDTAIASLAKNLTDYLTKIKIKRIKGNIIASPATGNAPLIVTLRASEIVDPSWVSIPKGGYIWWIRAAGGGRTIIGTGPSISYTFSEERTYTVFLNVLSSSLNKNGKTDVLPFESSVNVNVLPKLGNISLAINGIYASNLDKIKFTPSQGRQGLLIDATASTPAAGTKFVSTRFDFGNGNISQYNNSPSLDRQIYSNEGIYKLKMEVMTNENKKITKELEIEIRDPISTIWSDKSIGFPREEFHFSALSSASSSDLGHSWNITELENEKSLFTSNLQNIAYKFPRTGKYAVKLRTLAPNGKEDYDTLVITIEGRDPIATFDTKTVSSELPNVFLLDATKSYDPDNLDGGNLSYSWIVDGIRTDLMNPTRNSAIGKYTFDTVGTHRIALEVSNKEGKTVSYTKDVTVNSLLSVKLITSPKIAQAGSSVSFVVDSKEAQAFEWQFGDGESDTSTTGRINHIYKKAGTYSVSVTVQGRNSDSNSISRKVYVRDSITPFAVITLKRDNEEFIPVPDSCNGNEAFIIDRSKAMSFSAENSVNIDGTNQGISYTWKYAGNRNSSQRDFSYKFDELGCFPISLTVRSQKTGMQHTVNSYVKTENLSPKISSLSIVADKPNADPVTVSVTAENPIDEDGAIASYIWYYYTEEDPEPQDFRITRSPKTVFVLPRVGAKYYFAVILEDSNGMKVNSDEMSTERYFLTLTSDNINTPIIGLKASKTSISVGEKVDFTVTARNILWTDLADKAEYKWDFNGDGFYEETTNVPKVTHTYDAPGNFNFKIKVTYKGISNTKYQAITVKNEIQPNLEYIAIGKKFLFLNTTKGLYTKVKWSLGDVSSTSLDSFVYDFGENPISEKITLEVSDGKDTKSISASLRKDIVNALKVKKSSEKILYFSYPSDEDDTIHITDSTEKLFLYLGESKGTIAKYGIDTDISVDSDLNGTPDDDIDNKGTDSATNGTIFTLKSSAVSAKKKVMRLSIYDTNDLIIETKDITVIYDFLSDTDMESLSWSISEEISKDISEVDKVNLEKLKDLIRNSKEQDRLKMMQYFSLLQENWFDTREKTKTIIDFETYIDYSSALDTKSKEEFYSLLEGFLLTDTQVKDDIALATKVLKSLIPKTNPSYTQIIQNIDDILSHPTNTILNKELGTFILNAIKDDTTIEVKDKNIIKSQLQTIIYGGQDNIPDTAPLIQDDGNSGGILGFLLGFGKILGFILLGLLGIALAGFVYFKVFNRDENIGFQDFIIDKISGKRSTEKSSISDITPLQREVYDKEEDISQTAVLANITPDTAVTEALIAEQEKSLHDPLSEAPVVSTENSAVIPDWLKESTSFGFESPVWETPSPENPLEDFAKQDILVEKLSEEPVGQIEPLSTVSEEILSQEPISDMPPWLQGMDQESLKEEVKEEIATPKIVSEPKTDSYEDIPDWLKSASLPTESPIEEAIEAKISGSPIEETNQVPKESAIPELEEIVAVKTTPKKSVKKPAVKKEKSEEIVATEQQVTMEGKMEQEKTEESEMEKIEETEENISLTPSKKKKPTPIVSGWPTIPIANDELPDWLK